MQTYGDQNLIRILDTHVAVEPSLSRNLTEIVVYEYSTHCFSLDFGNECLQRRKKKLVRFRTRLQDERRRQNPFAKSGLRN